jgi:hypothetical protein
MVQLCEENEHQQRNTEMQSRFPSPSLSTGLHAAGPSPSGPAAIILICLVMASGAAFGIAAQISLQRLGLDFDSIRSDVLAHRAATPHFALAWWAWWLVALGAFLVGPLCAAASRAIVGGGQLMGGLGSFAMAIALLGLAAVAQPRSFPPATAVAANPAISLLAVIGSTVLALLGARLLGGMSPDRAATPLRARVRDGLRHLQGSTPCPAIRLRSEGSANSGLPVLRARRRHQLVHRSFSSARAALVTGLAVLVFVPVSVLAGSTVLLHLSPAGTVRAWNLSRAVLTDTASETRSPRQMLLPTDEGGFTVPVATEAPGVPSRVELPAAQKLEITTAIGHGPARSESELTFTKGYPQRRAAQLAAGMISQPVNPQLTTAADVANSDVFDPPFGQGARIPRSVAESRPRIRKHRHDRYAEFNP